MGQIIQVNFQTRQRESSTILSTLDAFSEWVSNTSLDALNRSTAFATLIAARSTHTLLLLARGETSKKLHQDKLDAYMQQLQKIKENNSV